MVGGVWRLPPVALLAGVQLVGQARQIRAHGRAGGSAHAASPAEGLRGDAVRLVPTPVIVRAAPAGAHIDPAPQPVRHAVRFIVPVVEYVPGRRRAAGGAPLALLRGAGCVGVPPIAAAHAVRLARCSQWVAAVADGAVWAVEAQPHAGGVLPLAQRAPRAGAVPRQRKAPNWAQLADTRRRGALYPAAGASHGTRCGGDDACRNCNDGGNESAGRRAGHS